MPFPFAFFVPMILNINVCCCSKCNHFSLFWTKLGRKVTVFWVYKHFFSYLYDLLKVSCPWLFIRVFSFFRKKRIKTEYDSDESLTRPNTSPHVCPARFLKAFVEWEAFTNRFENNLEDDFSRCVVAGVSFSFLQCMPCCLSSQGQLE
jgi:hypothetical protein